MRKTRAEIRAQHPSDAVPEKDIATQFEAMVNSDKRIACCAAHEISAELNCTPLKVGQTADLLQVRINRCQLGLFGHSNSATVAFSANEVTQEIKAAVESVISDGKITCKDSWRLSDQLNLSRLEIGALCDALKIKVSRCQLGAF